MTKIRPVSDLRNKYPEVEEDVNSGGAVFLTKNGHGSMVVMSIEEYDRLTDDIETKLDAADRQAALTSDRYSHSEVFNSLRAEVRDGAALQA